MASSPAMPQGQHSGNEQAKGRQGHDTPPFHPGHGGKPKSRGQNLQEVQGQSDEERVYGGGRAAEDCNPHQGGMGSESERGERNEKPVRVLRVVFPIILIWQCR